MSSDSNSEPVSRQAMRRTRPANCKAARMPGRGLEQAFETAAQIGRAADVRLEAGLFAIKRKDRRALRVVGQARPWRWPDRKAATE